MKNTKILSAFLLNLVIIFQIHAQIKPSTPDEIEESFQKRSEMASASILKKYPVRNIGPVVQGGRVTDIEVNMDDLKKFYVGFASGGLWYTENNGISFKPVFDNHGAMGIGDFAIAATNPDILYVGTGENNSSRSSYAGSGVYKTIDGGESWEYLGLPGIQHTGRVIIHPQDPNIVWVAAMGALYTHNDERGVYKTTDGGKSWRKTLFINDSTGIIDLLMNPQNPDQLWATAWERTRRAWNFKGKGLGTAIYRSDDGGENWQRLMKGITIGENAGRIGVGLSASQPNTLYALVDNQYETKEGKEEEDDKLTLKDFVDMSVNEFFKLDDKKLDKFLRENRFPEKYNAKRVKQEVSEGKYEPKAVAEYFGDANQALFDTEITGAEVYRSGDYGDNWEKINSHQLDGVYFTYGYYFGEIRVSPKDPEVVYIFGVPLLKSTDGGKNFHRLDTIGNVHVDHQALWINPNDPEHMLLGNDGGLYQSYDGGAEWLHLNNMPVGQFYTINVDMDKPYNVYGGLQDNGVLKGSHRSVPNRSEHWDRIFGGDGMFVNPDPRNSNIVYTGFQFGNYWRINLAGRERKRITPQHDIGDDRLRFNWRTPVILSPHNADIIYFGAQKLFRSMNQGESWELISPDLTKNLPQGNVPYSTITTISESPLKFGLIYIGTDDGNVQVSRNAGGDWENITGSLPNGRWVSKVFASPHDEATVFVSLNGYREDEFKTYIYKSTDYGKSWSSLKGNLPESVANVIIQDPVNPELLYTGLDNGTYVSLNGGATWELLPGMLNVASYDMIVHPRENDLVVGTHGRSVFVADAEPFQKVAGDNISKDILAFGPESIRHSERWGEKRFTYMEPFEPEVTFLYYIGKVVGNIKIEVKNEEDKIIREIQAPGLKGFHKISWDLKMLSEGRKKSDQALVYVDKGKYKIVFTNGSESDQIEFEVK